MGSGIGSAAGMGYCLNRLGLGIFASFVFLGIAIALYLMFRSDPDQDRSQR